MNRILADANKIFKKLKYYHKKLYGITTYALIGKSGTGKSYNSYIVAYQLKVNTIIDDGLLIHNGEIICGYSAKRATTRIGAVKRAIFYNNGHANEVKYYIKKLNIKKFLILGTSKNMIEKIITKLELPYPDKIIRIEDIVSQEDIKIAQMQRNNEGKHVMPVPELEIIKKYPDLFLNSFEVKVPDTTVKIQKSILRPTYSLPGRLTITNKVLKFYIEKIIMLNFPNVKINSISINQIEGGVQAEIEVGINFNKTNFIDLSKFMQSVIKTNFEYFTGRELLNIDIKVTEVIFD